MRNAKKHASRCASDSAGLDKKVVSARSENLVRKADAAKRARATAIGDAPMAAEARKAFAAPAVQVPRWADLRFHLPKSCSKSLTPIATIHSAATSS